MSLAQTEFCTISYRDGDSSIDEVLKAVRKAESENRNLFKINPRPYFVELVYSNEQYDRKTGLSNVQSPRGGYAHNNRITLISPKVKRLPFDVNSFFYHEVNHVFYSTLTGSYHPLWLSEGMAAYHMKTYGVDAAGWKKFFRAVKKPERFLYYRYLKKKYYSTMNEFYALSFLVYGYLDKKYGRGRIMRLLNEFSKKPSKPNFDVLLKKHFNFSLEEIVQKAIK